MVTSRNIERGTSRSPLSKPALLCVVPPYTLGPPAGVAYLLAYVARQGCSDFGFVDLRLGIPDSYAPTYSHTGVFGDSYVMDVPDLPLVLSLVHAVDTGADLTSGFPFVLESYCRDRGISATYLGDYLACLDRYFAGVIEKFSSASFVGCSIWTSNFLTTLLFAAHLKRRRRPPIIVGGGPQVTESYASAAIALRSRLLDYVVTGEGEASLLEIYSRVGGATGCVTVPPLPGTLALDEREEVRRGEERPLLKYSDIPLPTFDLMPLVAYQQPGSLRWVPYQLSRGCTDKCTFCSEWKFWKRFRLGDPGPAVAGIRELNERYGAEYIAFTDSLLNGHPARLREFAEAMLLLTPKITWSGFMRAEMDFETATLLRRSGCNSVFVGVESMADQTLALMNKRRTEQENIKSVRAFLRAGIRVVAGLIPGFPGDSREAFIHSVNQIRSLQLEFPGQLRVNVEPFILSPGQPLFASLDEAGLRGIHWNDEVLDLAPRYKDITASIFSTVTGSNQGMERVGRLRIAEAMECDEPTRTDVFSYKLAEALNRADFYIQPLTAGWYLARLKGPAALIYGLIVEDQERVGLDNNGELDALSSPRLRRTLKKLEAEHLLKPLRLPTLTVGGYSRVGPKNISYQLAPCIVARPGGWRLKNRLIVADVATAGYSLLPSWHGFALTALRRAPQTAQSLQKNLARRGIDRTVSNCIQLLRDLRENGAVIRCG